MIALVIRISAITLASNSAITIAQFRPSKIISRVQQEPVQLETGSFRIAFPGTESGTGTARTVVQKQKPEQESCMSFKTAGN